MARTMTIRLKEKMMMSRDARMESIKRAKRDMGSPHILAPLRMSLYILYVLIGITHFWLKRSDHDSDEIGKDTDHGPCDEHEHQYACDAFFKVCVLPKKMACIEQEADQKDDP
tara:strand:+ start:21443 stop:21781 length:339 start_codon:yes stop_codon:yes gene_type:complete